MFAIILGGSDKRVTGKNKIQKSKCKMTDENLKNLSFGL